jgi:hypothetical protein
VAFVDVARVAKALNLQVRRVQYLVKEGMPRQARGKYDPVKCMLWYVRYLQRLLEKKSLPQRDGTEREERVRLLRAKADLRELEVSRERSQLISTADYQAAIANLVETTTTYVMAVAPRLASDLIGETSRLMIQARIEKACKEALSNLSKAGRRATMTWMVEQPPLPEPQRSDTLQPTRSFQMSSVPVRTFSERQSPVDIPRVT